MRVHLLFGQFCEDSVNDGAEDQQHADPHAKHTEVLSRKLKPTASRIMPVRMGMSMAWKADIGIMVGTALS